jgi:mannose-6-phosphate isomerase-like protein (cupin superfamily)
MKLVRKDQAKKFKNSDVCFAYEFPLGDKDINGAVIELSGRYPDSGRVVNQKCKELAYVMRGSGGLVVEGEKVKLKEGDMVLIEAGERYYWDGDMVMFVPCVPAWYSDQHKEVE